jgi:hypothetical protein
MTSSKLSPITLSGMWNHFDVDGSKRAVCELSYWNLKNFLKIQEFESPFETNDKMGVASINKRI